MARGGVACGLLERSDRRIAISASACVASRARRSLASRSRVRRVAHGAGPVVVQTRSARGWVLATSPARLSTYRASGTCRTSVRALPCIQRHIDTHYRETVGGAPRRLVGNAGGQPACRRPGVSSRVRADRQPPRQQGEHSRPQHGRQPRPQRGREPRPGCGRQPRPQSRLRPGHCPCGGGSPGGASSLGAWQRRRSVRRAGFGAGGPGWLAAELDGGFFDGLASDGSVGLRALPVERAEAESLRARPAVVDERVPFRSVPVWHAGIGLFEARRVDLRRLKA
jgi:hypothetical protein